LRHAHLERNGAVVRLVWRGPAERHGRGRLFLLGYACQLRQRVEERARRAQHAREGAACLLHQRALVKRVPRPGNAAHGVRAGHHVKIDLQHEREEARAAARRRSARAVVKSKQVPS